MPTFTETKASIKLFRFLPYTFFLSLYYKRGRHIVSIYTKIVSMVSLQDEDFL